MNRCYNCNRKLEKGTVWCPYCGQEQSPKYNIFSALFVLIVVACLVIFGCYKYKEGNKKTSNSYKSNIVNKKSNNTPKITSNISPEKSDIYYKIENENKTDTSYEITGYIFSKRKETLKNAYVLFICFDDNGNVLGEIKDSTPSIEYEQFWKFTVRYNGKASRCVYDKFMVEK